MKIFHARLQYRNKPAPLFGAVVLLLFFAVNGAAQSTDIGFPTPVRSGEISGTIAPRDLGDPRLTRYFYAFKGTPGDLIITAESENLEGDVDVFTAGALRPLAKISLYALGTTSGGSKTIYLKTRESLILRVEARTPNDNAGSFRVRFNGAFEPLGSDVPDPEPITPTLSAETSAPKKGRRVTATGARIEEPEPEPAVTTGSDANASSERATDSSASTTSPETTTSTTAEAAKPEPPKPRTTRSNRRGTRSSPRNTRTRPTATARRTTPKPVEPTVEPAPAIEPAAGPRLIIETKDGMRVERYMTTVRRLTVDKGQIVVVTTDGKIDRQPMSNVLRMAIEP
ncbi:MAG TPA: hypothetical protein VM095_18105 [Pyrinomonadaceae bacterium]|nr:hypothetical protein [Pyrinomonadaceae bacterium]